MNKQWYQQTESEICTFFDVDPLKGLSQKDALNRLDRFRPNIDPQLSQAQQRILKVTVIRQGRRERIQFSQLVPGDIVVLQPGSRVPCDLRLIKVESLSINQNLLTGESLPSLKNTFSISNAVDPVAQKCMAFAGSFVISGSGFGIVVERGSKTVLAQIPKKRAVKVGLRGSVIARRLKRFGVIVQHKRALATFRKINTVVIDADIKESEIIEIIRKVQLTRNIECKFAVSSVLAERLKQELQAEVYDASTNWGDLFGCQLITNLNSDNALWLATQLSTTRHILWVSNGSRPTQAYRAVGISLVYGDKGRDDILLTADIVAPRSKADIITRILYNKK